MSEKHTNTKKPPSIWNVFTGRLNRTDYFMLLAILIVFVLLLKFLLPLLPGSDLLEYAVVILMFILFYPIITFMCKRSRDIGISAWFLIAIHVAYYLTPTFIILHYGFYILVLIVNIALAIWPGAKGENKYGEYFEIFPNPLRKIIGKKIKFFS